MGWGMGRCPMSTNCQLPPLTRESPHRITVYSPRMQGKSWQLSRQKNATSRSRCAYAPTCARLYAVADGLGVSPATVASIAIGQYVANAQASANATTKAIEGMMTSMAPQPPRCSQHSPTLKAKHHAHPQGLLRAATTIGGGTNRKTGELIPERKVLQVETLDSRGLVKSNHHRPRPQSLRAESRSKVNVPVRAWAQIRR